MTQNKKYSPTDVKVKWGELEIDSFAEGTYIEITPHKENPYFSESVAEVIIELTADSDSECRKWTEHFLGVWRAEGGTENN